ncbi:putative dihydrofolate synthetase isoform X2 [Chlorella sorokiniana]|uniref:tetrahydrofolate synthase n=1 Tax=Chlorella sorokiniana TaxID=3076 RepID=A0A2P6TUC0_CHLSO|nr:putative dihydrofolate synthetase isoform X2 [Chlorella sorokiniana]|eukprot:PRW57665.1 putative dihydrofolate synthetase isoform X2 [Chlorella sorokiniana]
MLRAVQQWVAARPASAAAAAGPLGGARLYSAAALAWLERFVNYERKGVPAAAGTDSDSGFDLGRMRRLLADLGDPQAAWPAAVHVAGTKGKGSTVAMLAAILRAAGYKAGAYTSPHITCLNERISVGGAPISDAALDALVARHAAAIEAAAEREAAAGQALSHFEIVTALAFKHFQEQQVDAAVIEVGLGGVRDATNVLQPASLAAAVVTAVGHDHAAALGGTIERIAAAKAGIMQAGRPVVLGRQPEASAQTVLLARAEELGSPVTQAPADVQFSAAASTAAVPTSSSGGSSPSSGAVPALLWQQARMALSGQTAAALAGPGKPAELDVRLRLLGEHQLDNAAAAVAAAARLRQHGLERIDLQAVAAGLEAATLPGRFQLCQFQEDADAAAAAAAAAARAAQGGSSGGVAGEAGPEPGPWVVLDGAHTPESAAALARTLRQAFPTAPVALVVAMAEDKQHREICQELRAIHPHVAIFTSVPIAGGAARCAGPGQLAGAWQAAAILGGGRTKGGVRTRELIQASLTAAVEKARMELKAQRTERGVVLVCGSLHAVGAALAQLPLVPC